MTAEVEREFEDVLTALGTAQPAGPSPAWAARLQRAVQSGAPHAGPPLRRAFDAHADDLLAYAAALLGGPWQAEHVVVEAFARLQPTATPPLSELLQHARHVALELLAKSQATPAPDTLAPADHALVLERRLGVPLRELARSWSAVPAWLEQRLLAAGQLWLAQAGGPPDCPRAEQLTRAALDLLSGAEAEAHGEHVAACDACAPLSEALEEIMSLPDATLPAPDATWKAIAARVEPQQGPDAQELGIVVSVSCCFCHDRLRRTDAAFCATCLAPHHPDCFEAHGGCSTLGCAGQELVLPSSMTPRRRVGGLGRSVILSLVAGAALASVAAVAMAGALVAWTSQERFLGGNRPVSAAPAPTADASSARASAQPIPSAVQVGCSRETLIDAFGEPDRTHTAEDDDGETRLSWYALGLKAIVDAQGRLLMATFFGSPEMDPDAIPDANGNRTIPDGPFRSGDWTWRGVRVGASGPEAYALLAGADEVTPDANGNQWASYDAEQVIVAIGADRVVLAFHVGGRPQPDANGNVVVLPEPSQLEALDQEWEARDALARVLQQARQTGRLERVLGRRTYAGYDDSGRLEAVYEVQVDLLDDAAQAGLAVTVTSRDLLRGGPTLVDTSSVSFEGALLRVGRSSPDEIQDYGIYLFEGLESAPGRLELEVVDTRQDDRTPHTRVLYSDAGHLPSMVEAFVFSVLADALGEHWSVRAQDPRRALYGEAPFTVRGDADVWQGRPVRTLNDGRTGGQILLDPASGAILQIRSDELVPYSVGWLEPVSPERYQELTAGE